MTDSLLAAAGLLSPSVAGEALALDYMEEEQKRQMTIKAANVSLYYEFGGKPYVINLIDTPGHIDFTGMVTRSLRAIDGAVVVVDAVEGVMTQTETVTRQALEERVRPVLYVNKIDRLITELRLTPSEVQNALGRIIRDFNELIQMYGEPGFRESWRVNPANNTVAFGSAKHRWGFTLGISKDKGVKFSDVVDAYKTGSVENLSKTLPLHEAILNMVVEHMPPPHVAQKYRISKIWRGSLDSEVGKAMETCDDNGPTVMCVSKVNVDPQAGIIATGRLFSGTLTEGQNLYLISSKSSGRVQQVCIYMGPYREIVGSLPAGNIPAVLGLGAARAGETLASLKDVVPFEAIRYVTEPVMTIAVEPKYSRDLPRLVEVLNKLSIEDPTLVTKIDQESGEYLISGMGQVHLEIAQTLIQKTGLEIVTSRPIVIYRESIRESAGPYMGKSPNKHNRAYISVEPLAPEVIEKIISGEINDALDRRALAKILRDLGWDAEEARNVWSIDQHGCLLVDRTKGVQYLNEVRDYITSGFLYAMDDGPLTREYVRGVKVNLEKAELHSDPVHRGPAQIIPMVRRAIFAGLLSADPILLEPIMKLAVKAPLDMVGTVTKIISGRRGQIASLEQREYVGQVIAEIPAVETFDLADVLRSMTSGRAFWSLFFSRWSPVPQSMLPKLIEEIRRRKGLSAEPPRAEEFMDRD
ncbi:MAG: elongation factor EF-2 [Candidatus Bathyarchaeia archaeon]